MKGCGNTSFYFLLLSPQFHVESLKLRVIPLILLLRKKKGACFQIPKDIENIYPTSLMSHELCPITEKSLTTSLSEGKVPDAETIQMLNEFSKINNSLRSSLRAKSTYENKLKFSQHWSKLAGCLAYAESLTTADSAQSKEIAARNAPKGYVRPAGVGFYEDPNQPQESRLNIGLYQFTPNIGGNIQACARQWNEMFPSCKINLKASDAESFKLLGSELQAFKSLMSCYFR
jgi:hypothetical protein